MHFQFMTEDLSGALFVKAIMNKYLNDYPNNTFDIKRFHGIGGFNKKNTVKETKDGKLLNDLATYMPGFQKRLQGIEAVIVVVLDNDDNETDSFKESLENVAKSKNVSMDHVFCIAIEELEAWLLGDENAVKNAYPKYKQRVLSTYRQDSICGTWEVLADTVYPGGLKAFKKECKGKQVGKKKCEWVTNISAHLSIQENKSPSFQAFNDEIRSRLDLSPTPIY